MPFSASSRKAAGISIFGISNLGISNLDMSKAGMSNFGISKTEAVAATGFGLDLGVEAWVVSAITVILGSEGVFGLTTSRRALGHIGSRLFQDPPVARGAKRALG